MACSSTVSRTALDALHAKLSALSVGYTPVQYNGKEYNELLYKISENVGNNGDEKSTKRHTKVVRRQTPLVNAGYAIRVFLISKALERFIRINTEDNNTSDQVNVVVLGCGLDMLGLWASHTFPSKLKLFEVDCQEIVDLKKNALIKSGLVEEVQSFNDQSDKSTIFTGVLKRSKTEADDTEVVDSDNFENYSLMACDLRDVASLQRLFSHSSIDTDKPTIVISELVLAYLGDYDCVATLMQYISSEICISSGSIFLAYEPVGPTYQTINKLQQQQNIISVQSGYFMDYHQLFSTKMVRGDQKKLSSLKNKIDTPSKDEDDSANMVITPIGISCSDVRRLTRQLHGFDGPVDCCTAADVLPHMLEDNDDFQTPEIFDEHAALALHLSSYALLCAGSYTASNTTLRNFLKLSPWSNPDRSANFMGYRYQKKYHEKNLNISTIKKNDDEEVQKMFKSSYVHLFEEYSPVKKLVKNALKTDLSSKANNIIHTLNGMDFGNDESTSPIYLRYSEEGGSFWVATEDEIDSKEKLDTARKILGCIGIRLYKGKDYVSGETETCFEINRLVIHSNYRSKGIGTLLLETAYSFAKSKCISQTMKFIASTPEILQPANFFYKASGFDQIKSENIGKMVINTYIKTLK